jgi:hypothetical protein
MFDPDPAGWSATVALITALTPFCRVYVIDAPPGKDLADMAFSEASALARSSDSRTGK